MTNPETTFNSEEIYGDIGLSQRVREGLALPGPVMRVAGEFKDIVLGAFDGLRQHPVGAIEISAATFTTGAVAGALTSLALARRH